MSTSSPPPTPVLGVPLDYQPPPPRRFSMAGEASFGLGLASVALCFVMLTLTRAPGATPLPAWLALVAFVAAVAVPSAGLALGIVSLRTPDRRRGLAVIGVILNGLTLTIPLLLIVLFIATGR